MGSPRERMAVAGVPARQTMDPITKPLLFLHIPKTGGSTLKTCLNQFLYQNCETRSGIEYVEVESELTRFWIDGIFYFPTGFYLEPSPAHFNYEDIILKDPNLRAVIGHFSYGIHESINKECQYFTFIRNPIDRVLSLYYHQVHRGVIKESVGLPDVLEDMRDDYWAACLSDWYPNPPNFSEGDIRRASSMMFCNDQTRRISGFTLQDDVTDDEMLERAKNNLINDFAFFGVNELFDESLLLLSKMLGLQKVPNYLPLLVNQKRKSIPTISQEIENLIKQKNILDIQLYEYATAVMQDLINSQGMHFVKDLEKFKKENEIYKQAHESEMGRWNLT
jgi:hypothetical protein